MQKPSPSLQIKHRLHLLKSHQQPPFLQTPTHDVSTETAGAVEGDAGADVAEATVQSTSSGLLSAGYRSRAQISLNNGHLMVGHISHHVLFPTIQQREFSAQLHANSPKLTLCSRILRMVSRLPMIWLKLTAQ